MFIQQRRSVSGPCFESIDACTTDIAIMGWITPLISVAIPIIMLGQAVAKCCNTGVSFAFGDIRHPKCVQLVTYQGNKLTTSVLLHLAVSESLLVESLNYLCLDATKPVFRVSDKARLKHSPQLRTATS